MLSVAGCLWEVVAYESLDLNGSKFFLIRIWWLQRHMRECRRSQFREKKTAFLPIEKFPFLALARDTIMLQHLITHFSFHYLSSGRLREVNFKVLALKVAAVAYERWSLTRGSKYSDLTGKRLVFWKTSRWGEVVAYERWSQSQPEVWRQYAKLNNKVTIMQYSRLSKHSLHWIHYD